MPGSMVHPSASLYRSKSHNDYRSLFTSLLSTKLAPARRCEKIKPFHEPLRSHTCLYLTPSPANPRKQTFNPTPKNLKMGQPFSKEAELARDFLEITVPRLEKKILYRVDEALSQLQQFHGQAAIGAKFLHEDLPRLGPEVFRRIDEALSHAQHLRAEVPRLEREVFARVDQAIAQTALFQAQLENFQVLCA